MKYVVAVSGGVDSVVLLDMLAKNTDNEIVVAHFEHGIRGESSLEDARFVGALARKYSTKYEFAEGNLGQDASEEEARIKRYEFLKQTATKYGAQLVTAHHKDDLVETIMINLVRGTGWRGLAVFGDASIERPLLHMRKADIYSYALQNNLEWVEDETNASDKYLRNRMRQMARQIDENRYEKLYELYERQVGLKVEIDELLKRSVTVSRYFLVMIDEKVAIELLRTLLLSKNTSLTRPQLQRLLLTIKTAKPGDILQPGGGVMVQFSLRELIVK